MPERDQILAPTQHCESCGSPIPAGAPGGQCPRCLLSLASSSSLDAAADDALLDADQVREFGDFELLEEIARGGMGVVYHAWQLSAGREVAVKMILAGQLATADSLARFRNEAAAAAKLDHPNIVPVYEIGEFETQHYFSMRYVPGRRNIAQWARALPPERRFQAIALAMAEVARAVAFAHERGVLHRDLKPSNILVDENDEPQITDFGLAKLLDADTPALTLTSAILGSPSYMAPEQTGGRHREITTATDVYGLGAILYELLSGRPPFTGASPHLVARKVIEDPPRRLFDVPEDLETLCRKCLAKDPRDRYASAAALAEDLDRFARGEPVLAVPESSFSMIVLWARHKPIAASLAVALAFTLLAGFAGISWQWRHAEKARRETIAANLQISAANAQLRATIAHLEWREIDVLLERDYASRAIANLADRLRRDPQSWQAASYAISILEQRPFAFPAGPAVVLPEGTLLGRPAFSADGRRVAYATKEWRVRVIDTASGTDACAPLAAGAEIAALAFSPDSTLLAAGCADGAIVLWQMPAGQFVSRTATPATPLRAFTFSADGRSLAVAGGEFVASGAVEDFVAGQTPLRLLTAGFPPAEIRTSADGRILLARGVKKEQPLAVWGPPGSGAPFLSPPGGEVRGAALDASGRRAAIISGPYEAQVWDLDRRAILSTIRADDSTIDRIALTPDGERVVVTFAIGQTRVFSAVTGLPISRPMSQLYYITSLALDAAGRRALTGSYDYKARLWDVETGDPISEPIPHRGRIEHVALDAAGDRALTLSREAGAQTRYLQVWQCRDRVGPVIFQPPGTRDLNVAHLSPGDRFLAVNGWGATRNTLTVYEVATHRAVLDRAPTGGDVYAAEFTPDLRRFIAATSNGWLLGWSVADWQPLWPAEKLPSGLQPATLAPDGHIFAAGCTDGVLRLYDPATGQLVREMQHGALIKSVYFTLDSARIVTGGVDGIARIWETDSGKKLATLTGHRAEILSARFSPDGTRVITGSYDSTARIWDAATGQPLGAPLTHSGELSQVLFSPDGRRVATASRDGTARIWDGFTGTPLVAPMSRPDTVQTVQFHPDGRRLVTLDLGGFRLWDVATGEPITIEYAEPSTGGLGVDSPTFRDLISHDGRHLIIGTSFNAGQLWPLLDPPPGVPAWFPDFLDIIASGGIDLTEPAGVLPGKKSLDFRERAAHFGDTDFYEAWVRSYLGLKRKPDQPR